MPSLDPSEEAAHIALEAGEKAVRAGATVISTGADIAGKTIVGLSYLLEKIINAEYRTKGVVPKKYFNGKPTAYFTILRRDLVEFTNAAKQYGVAYSVILDKTQTDPMSEVDILIQDSSASLVQRIMDRYGFNMPEIRPEDVAKDGQGIDKDNSPNAKDGQSVDEKGAQTVTSEKSADTRADEDVKQPAAEDTKTIDPLQRDEFVNLMNEQQVDLTAKQDKKERPTQARTDERNTQFARSSETTTEYRASTRSALKAYKQEEKNAPNKDKPRSVGRRVNTMAAIKPNAKEGRSR